MRTVAWFSGALVVFAVACSSSKSDDSSGSSGSSGGSSGSSGSSGGGGSDTCSSYGATIAQKAPDCGGIPDVAGTFAASCQAALDPMKTCTSEYKTLLSCQAAGSRCDGGKIALGPCDAETGAYSKCTTTVTDPDAGPDTGTTCTIAKLDTCGTGSGCCANDLSCGVTSDPDRKLCCVELKKTCASPADCCQSKGRTFANCELGVCCVIAGEACTTASECCTGALCTGGVCVP